jgi:hypothetical protein
MSVCIGCVPHCCISAASKALILSIFHLHQFVLLCAILLHLCSLQSLNFINMSLTSVCIAVRRTTAVCKDSHFLNINSLTPGITLGCQTCGMKDSVGKEVLFPKTPRLAQGPTQPPTQWALVVFPLDMTFTFHPHLVLRLQMRVTVYSPIYFQACQGDTLLYLPGNKYSKTTIMKCGTAVFSYFVKAHISATTNGY